MFNGSNEKPKFGERFSTIKIGRKISELRKKNNMTQFELADRLEISFQAVSNWERGNSMPDISKLPELAEIFNVSIDEILGSKSRIIEEAADGRLEEYAKENEVNVKELAEAAPLLKPEQIEAVAEKSGDNLLDNLDSITELLPYLDEEYIDSLAKRIIKSGEELPGSLMPFLSEDTVYEMAKSYRGKGLDIKSYLLFF